MDPFDDLYARVIVEHALAVRAGQSVLIECGELAEPLARAVHRRVLEVGAHPAVQMLPEGWIEAKAECAASDVLGEADPLKLVWSERVGALVSWPGATASTRFARPKSRILRWPSIEMKMFSGFRSRWTTPFSWAAESPRAICSA